MTIFASKFIGNRIPVESGESDVVAKFLAGRYGALALTRAAGEAAAAQRRGDSARFSLWQRVISQLRQSVTCAEANGACA